MFEELEDFFTTDKTRSKASPQYEKYRSSNSLQVIAKKDLESQPVEGEECLALLEELKMLLIKPGSSRQAVQLFKLQGLLIKTSDLLATSLTDTSNDKVRAEIYACLKKIALRPELSLQSIGYDKE